MKAFTNTNLIETRAKWAKRIAPLTMFFLIGGLDDLAKKAESLGVKL